MLPLEPDKRYTLADELANLTRWSAELAERMPDRASEFERSRAALSARAASLPPAESGPAHRDFYYSQLLYAGRRTTLIDFDMLALADPALDVGNFRAHLLFLGLQNGMERSEVDDARLVLLEQYLRMTGWDDTFRERVDFYEAATLFRLMQVVMQKPEYAKYFEALFALARAPMEQLEWSEAG